MYNVSYLCWPSKCHDSATFLFVSELSLYDSTKDFTCLDGSVTIPFSSVNDDYCDCQDGTDEPGGYCTPNPPPPLPSSSPHLTSPPHPTPHSFPPPPLSLQKTKTVPKGTWPGNPHLIIIAEKKILLLLLKQHDTVLQGQQHVLVGNFTAQMLDSDPSI